MKILQIHCIEKMEHVAKFNKYAVTLQFHGRAKGDFWLSEKQAKRLNTDMGESDYSTKKNVVWCAIDESGNKPRYVWSGRNQPGHDWLMAKFGGDNA